MKQRLLFWCLCILALAGRAQTENDLTALVQRKGDSLLKAEALPGLFVAVLNGSRHHYFSFGYAVPERKMAFDSATLFEAGSITKTFTAFIVESVLRQKQLSDSTRVIGYLPDSVKANAALAGITFLSLLNHTSGLPRLPDNLDLSGTAPYDNYTEQNLFSFLKRAKPQPDGNSHYSNLGAGLAGVLAQRISGKDFVTLLNQIIYQPFGLGLHQPAPGQPKAQGYFNNNAVPFWNMAALAPAGSLQCTAIQLLRYLRVISTPPTPHIKAVTNLLLQPTVRLSPAMQVARGWHTLEQKGKPTFYWHNGGTYGFSTFAAFVPGTAQAVVVVANRFNANNATDGFGIWLLNQYTALQR